MYYVESHSLLLFLLRLRKRHRDWIRLVKQLFRFLGVSIFIVCRLDFNVIVVIRAIYFASNLLALSGLC